MLYIIYKFNVKEGKVEQFIKTWTEVTQAFIDNCGALGSRLHKNTDSEYIAYAQWPSAELRDKAKLPAEVQKSSYAEMASCCAAIEVLYELTPIADLLVDVKSNKA